MHLAILLFIALALANAAKVPTDPAAIEAGKQIYMGSCSGCHGPMGEGSQGPSLLSGRASRLADDNLFHSIKNGLPGTSMPNFPLPDDKVWQIAAFVRSLTAPGFSMKVPGDAERGKRIFFGEGKCSGCHMILGQGGYPGPDLSNTGAERTLHQIRESITKPSARIEEGYRAAAAALKSGATLRGVARNWDNYTVQLMDKSGKLHLLDRSSLAKFEVMDQSMMPAADPAHVADLLAFLARQSTRKFEGDGR
ncbi:MAG: c-type cytochrome [Bryobacteraceae bacterium]